MQQVCLIHIFTTGRLALINIHERLSMYHRWSSVTSACLRLHHLCVVNDFCNASRGYLLAQPCYLAVLLGWSISRRQCSFALGSLHEALHRSTYAR